MLSVQEIIFSIKNALIERRRGEYISLHKRAVDVLAWCSSEKEYVALKMQIRRLAKAQRSSDV